MKKVYKRANNKQSGGKYKAFENSLVKLLKDNGVEFKTANVRISAQVLNGLYEDGDSRSHQLMHLYGDALEEGGYNKYWAKYLYQTDEKSLNRLRGFQQRMR